MKKHLFSFFNYLVIVVIYCLCIVSVQGKEQIVICGTGDSQDLLRNLARYYEKFNPGSQINVPESIGSSGGVKATAAGKCDLGRVARPLKESEKKYKLNYQLFGYTMVVFAVNQSVSDVENLTDEQLVSIYSGKLTNWKELGGNAGKIFVTNRESGDSSRVILENKIAGFKNISSFAGEILYSTPDTIETIAKYKNTIGYVPLAMTLTYDVKILKINGIEPLPEKIYQNKYPLVEPLGIVWKGKLAGLARNFLSFILSPKGKSIIGKNGSVSSI